MSGSGQTLVLAQGITHVMGRWYALLAGVLGVIGSFVTGSNMSSNILFTDVQVNAAADLGVSSSPLLAAQTAGGKAAQFLSVPLESIGTAMTTYASQNMGAHDLKRVDRGVNTALGIGCVYSVASFLILRVLDVPLISLFLESSEVEIMANARSFIFWNSVFYIPLAVLIIYRYTIQGLGYSGLAMFAGVAEMVARAMVGFWFVPLWGYFAACIANPVAWFFACFFLIPAYFAVRNRLMKENAYGVGD